MVTGALTKILGAQVLRDMQTFVAAFDTLFGGFRQRAQKTFELLQADGTAFLVVAAPEPDALREAAYFVERLSEDDMPLAGLVVNRASPQPQGDVSRRRGDGRGAQRLARDGRRTSLTAGLLRLHADRCAWSSARRGCGAASRRRTRRCRRPSCRRWPATCTTSTDCVRSARSWRGAADLTLDARRVSLIDVLVSAAQALMATPACCSRAVSRTTRHEAVRTTAQQGSALALGHPAPDAPLDLVVESLGEALGAHRAPGAQLLGLVLLRSTDEQLVGLLPTARGRAAQS